MSPAAGKKQRPQTGPRDSSGRWADTALLCGAFLGLGMGIAVLGPTFKELAVNVNRNLSDISYIFAGRSLGYLGGSLVGGLLFDHTDHHLLIGISTLMTALGLYAIPWCTKIPLLMALISLIGLSMGILDTGGNLLILTTWGEQVGPYMQALHFSFALGAFLTPILAKPLLGGLQKAVGVGAVWAEAGGNRSETGAWSSVREAALSLSPFVWTYLIIATFVLLVSVSFLVIYLRSRPDRGGPGPSSPESPFARHHSVLMCLLSLFFFCYVGAEVAYGAYIFTFAKDFASMDDNQAAGLNSLFWGTFAAVRGLAIFFAACLYPGTMILLSVVGCIVASLALVLYQADRTVLWLGTGLYGASMATTFPSGVTWVKQYTATTGRGAALFVFGAALGEMVVPATVGFLQGPERDGGHPVLMLTALAASVATAVLFPVMYKLATASASRPARARGEDQTALLGAREDEDGDGDGEEEGDGEWNDADFEVIEMSDVRDEAGKPTAVGKAKGQPSPERPPIPPIAYLGGSPKKKLLLLEREKND
ncbi:sodium-dependent glucose transporter 1 [Leucoraja erinacea]|uniref:sodium-dependent glucose transporter 1 n=1 Tax=Leucoraja erinaceus TaxID=7782 RepID=UPI002458B481|nr:sodium-dependent glucose transporter 1 [Leucoraja erinacea]